MMLAKLYKLVALLPAVALLAQVACHRAVLVTVRTSPAGAAVQILSNSAPHVAVAHGPSPLLTLVDFSRYPGGLEVTASRPGYRGSVRAAAGQRTIEVPMHPVGALSVVTQPEGASLELIPLVDGRPGNPIALGQSPLAGYELNFSVAPAYLLTVQKPRYAPELVRLAHDSSGENRVALRLVATQAILPLVSFSPAKQADGTFALAPRGSITLAPVSRSIPGATRLTDLAPGTQLEGLAVAPSALSGDPEIVYGVLSAPSRGELDVRRPLAKGESLADLASRFQTDEGVLRFLNGLGDAPAPPTTLYRVTDAAWDCSIVRLTADGPRPLGEARTSSLDLNPRFSSDGTQVLFSSRRVNARALWRHLLDASRLPATVTDEQLEAIAGTTWLSGAESRTLVLAIERGTTRPSLLIKDSSKLPFRNLGAADDFDISTSGSLLVLAASGAAASSSLIISDSQGRSHRDLSESIKSIRVAEARWSPDGKRIVLSGIASGEDASHLFLLDVASGHLHRVTSGAQWDDLPRWHPSGDQLFFRSNARGAWNLWRIPVPLTNGKPIKVDAGDLTTHPSRQH